MTEEPFLGPWGRFRGWVERTPGAGAISGGGVTLSYAELAERSRGGRRC